MISDHAPGRPGRPLLALFATTLHVGTASYPEITILDDTVVFDVRADVLLWADYLDFGVPKGGSLSPDVLRAHAAEVGALAARSIQRP